MSFFDILNLADWLKLKKGDRMNPVYRYFSNLEMNPDVPETFMVRNILRMNPKLSPVGDMYADAVCAVLRVPLRKHTELTIKEEAPFTKHGLRYQKLYLRTEENPAWHMPLYVLRPLPETEIGRVLIALQIHGPGATSLIDLVDKQTFPKVTSEVCKYYNYNTALDAVRMGFTLIVPEMRASGELKDPEKIALDKRTDFPFISAYSCGEYGGRLLHFGRTLLGMRVYDVMMLAYLLRKTKPPVSLFGGYDKNRIGMFGHSGGGTVALFASALLGKHIAATCVSGYFCTFKDSILAMSHCACNYVPGMAALGEMADITRLIAPRPLLIVAGKDDEIFPIHGARDAAKKVRVVFRGLGVEDKFAFHEQPGKRGKRGHRFPDGDFMYKWFKQQLL